MSLAELRPAAEQAAAKSIENLKKNYLRAALCDIWSLVDEANQYVDKKAPFKLAKDPSKDAGLALDIVLYNLAEACRVLAVLLSPFIPSTSEKIYAQLGLAGAPDKLSEAAWGKLAPGHSVGEPAPLFPRRDTAGK